VERRTISKGEIVYSCRRQNRDNICAIFLGVYALRYAMENHIISKGEKERKFLEIKENKSYILTPWECVFPWGFTVHDKRISESLL